jgi:cytidylate kinase
VVTEGRDQGTVAFPDAAVKFYLVADPTERARRRHAELESQGVAADLDQLRDAIVARDASDQQRTVGPLKPAPDAIVVDTTALSIEEVVEHLAKRVDV